MNGLQYTTGVVHATRQSPHGQLAPRCKRFSGERYALGPTERPITCKRCAAKVAAETTNR